MKTLFTEKLFDGRAWNRLQKGILNEQRKGKKGEEMHARKEIWQRGGNLKN
jgi:hypothetical protein